MTETLPTPCLLIDAAAVRRNLAKMAAYTSEHGLRLRPHTKTHKSTLLARMQLERGAGGLTVAKPGEAKVMAEVGDDILMAYPAVDPVRRVQSWRSLPGPRRSASASIRPTPPTKSPPRRSRPV